MPKREQMEAAAVVRKGLKLQRAVAIESASSIVATERGTPTTKIVLDYLDALAERLRAESSA